MPILLAVTAIGVRLAVWRNVGPLSWDEGAHSLAGIGLARYAFAPDELRSFFFQYWAASGSLFFYPWGYDLLALISYILVGVSDTAARLPAHASGLAFVPAMYLLGREVDGRELGLAAATLAVFTPTILLWSGQAMTDVPMVTLLTLSVVYLLKGVRDGRRRDWIVCAVLLGAAGQMKPPGFIWFAPMLLFGVIDWIRDGRSRHGLGNLGLFCIVSCSILGAYFLVGLVSPHLGLLGSRASPELVEFGKHISGDILHWLPWVPIFASAGDPTWREAEGWLYYLRLLPTQVGWITLILFAIGAVYGLRSPRFRGSALLFLCLAAFTYVVFAIIPNKDSRYTMIWLPALLILAALAFQATTRRLRIGVGSLGVGFLGLLLLGEFLWLGGSLRAPDVRLPIREVVDEIRSSAGKGLVVVTPETNALNVQNVSFYLAAADAALRYSVRWKEKLDQAEWVVSQEPLEREDFTLHSEVGTDATTRIRIYRTTRIDGPAPLAPDRAGAGS